MPLSPGMATRGLGNRTIIMIPGDCLTQKEHPAVLVKDSLSERWKGDRAGFSGTITDAGHYVVHFTQTTEPVSEEAETRIPISRRPP